jgi:hypothetical protein
MQKLSGFKTFKRKERSRGKVHVAIKLKYVLEEPTVRIWIGFRWLSEGSNGELFERGNILLDSIKPDHRSAFQGIHCTLNLGTWLYFVFLILQVVLFVACHRVNSTCHVKFIHKLQ